MKNTNNQKSNVYADNFPGNVTIVIPINHAINRTSDHYRQTLSLLSQKKLLLIAYHHYQHSVILFSISHMLFKHSGNTFHLKPVQLFPFNRYSFIQRCNDILSFVLVLWFALRHSPRRNKIILWIANPIFSWMMPIARKIVGSRLLVYYDDLDYLSSTQPHIESQLRLGERQLLEHSDIVTVNNQSLKQLHRKISNKIQLLPSGFRLKDFQNIQTLKPAPKPTIGYAGTISGRIDFNLLEFICLKNQDVTFELIGPIYQDEENSETTKQHLYRIMKLPNVTWRPYQHPRKLASVMSRWHAGFIPYDMSQKMNQYCQPLKIMEWFYLGIPIISPPFIALQSYGQYITLCNSNDDWLDAIQSVVTKKLKPNDRTLLKNIAIHNSWEQKINTFLNLIKTKLYETR